MNIGTKYKILADQVRQKLAQERVDYFERTGSTKVPIVLLSQDEVVAMTMDYDPARDGTQNPWECEAVVHMWWDVPYAVKPKKTR